MIAQSAGGTEYTDSIPAKPPKESPRYDTKQSDVEVPIMLEI